jgi:hypothetical protein
MLKKQATTFEHQEVCGEKRNLTVLKLFGQYEVGIPSTYKYDPHRYHYFGCMNNVRVL